ncbi:MAG: PEP-CTERM sorting domain-containing protein, partial [Planctomycetota bacterium]
FDPTASSVGFNGGIAHNGDTLMIGQSSVTYQFQTIAGVSDFQSDITTFVPVVQIASAIVPEPATMALLSLGAAMALRRKK